MSIERHPSGGYSFEEYVDLCESALASEDWEDVESEADYWKFDSVQLCKQLADQFDAYYHMTSFYRQLKGDELPLFLSEIDLKNPVLYLPNYFGPNTYRNVVITGEVPVKYIRIALDQSIDTNEQYYAGPHLIGIFDTDNIPNEQLERWELKSGYYSFITSFKNVEVAKSFIPTNFN